MNENKNKIFDIDLTEREYEILIMVVKGYSNIEVAEFLAISIHTVKAHVESIYRKFKVHNKVQAVIFAINNNIVDLNEI